MQKKTTGVVAGIAGAALLMGGTTFAMWKDSADVPGATLSSGNLEVTTSDWGWQDVSPDRSGGAHDIDLSDFKIIPGDVIQGSFDVGVTLEGDNMAALVQFTDANGDPITSTADLVDGGLAAGLVDISFDVAWNGQSLPVTFDGLADGIVLYSYDNTDAGTFQLPAASEEVTVTVTATFDEDTSDRVLTEAQTSLSGSGFTLSQMREGAAGYNG
ncbi:MAG TPA: alternate-type signal peptide domain-containing protein [Ruania sp.]|nr:alternate-type signal peptide domain-containing protein [Ruania sp.]